MNTEHIPVPSEHAPRKESFPSDGKLLVREEDNHAAWIKGDTMQVIE